MKVGDRRSSPEHREKLRASWWERHSKFVGSSQSEEERQFQVICEDWIKRGWKGTGHKHGGSLYQVGYSEFGLSHKEAKRAIGRARDWWAKILELSKERAARGLPVDSDEAIARLQACKG